MTTSFFEHVPITSQKWGKDEITGVVDTDAHDIELGLQLRGQGDAWIDDASLKFSSKPEYRTRAALISTLGLFSPPSHATKAVALPNRPISSVMY